MEWSTSNGDSEPPVITTCRETEVAKSTHPLEATNDDTDCLRVACRVHRGLQRTERPCQIDRRARPVRRRSLVANVDLFAQVDLVAVEEPAGEAEPGQPIRHDMVGAQIQRGTAALEALDQRAVPGRMVGVEGNRFEQPHEVEQLAKRSGSADRGSPQVMLGGGRVVFDPHRARVGERRITGPRLQPRRSLDDRGESFQQRVVAGCAVEHHHDADRHAQRRVLSGLPHDGFDGAEPFVHVLSLAPLLLRVPTVRQGLNPPAAGDPRRCELESTS